MRFSKKALAVAAALLVAGGIQSASSQTAVEATFYYRYANGDGTANCGGGCNPNQPLCYCCSC